MRERNRGHGQRQHPSDVTGGRKIADTGAISLDGSIGPIGGVQQKVAAAEAAGARDIKVVKIATVDEALAFLKRLTH